MNLKIIENVANEIIKNKDYLTDLDREIGDGDHGVNLSRGFEKILESINDFNGKTPSEIMMKIAMVLMSNVGGASGAIYSTAFMKAGQFLKDKPVELTPELISETWKQMIEGIQTRGNSKLGEKTLLDVQIPAFEAYTSSIKSGKSLKDAFGEATKAAEKAMNDTKNIIATKGRAAYLGERSKGHIDPGSASSYLIIKTIYDSIN
ncbi:MAG: dihydroxyacetone kinase subunit L [Malacoplasma sp.]|nr:dihydroxyacetone kinase subunit L [Malacoplasma sp.]MDE5774828.1 dihydroxyacetone kinase subunit L [Malacoplasma sp.]MDE7099784.1 dihydroxyacetone kinase subunit L [Malacoplasma sp.]